MKLLFDLQALQNGSRTRGIGRYVRSLFDALARRDDIELYALLNSAFADTLDAARDHAAARIGAARVLVFPGLSATSEIEDANLARRQLSEAAYAAFLDQLPFDVVLNGSIVEGFTDDSIARYSRDRDYLAAAVVHDLIPMFDLDHYLGWHKTRKWYFDRVSVVEGCDFILTNSDSSLREVAQFLSNPRESCATISAAYDSAIFNANGPDATGLLKRLGITKPFVMHTSAIEPRKNFDGLIRAFAAMPDAVRSGHQLVFVGKANEVERVDELRALAVSLGIPSADLVMPGFVADDDLARLYRSAQLFVFPTFHEGFGLPALEAMACGCATIGSNLTSIPEVIGNPEYLFDPHDSQSIGRLMAGLLTDPARHEAAVRHARSQAATFSWDTVADRAVAALSAAVDRRPQRQPAVPSARRMAGLIAGMIDLAKCPSEDVEMLARCLAASEDALTTYAAVAMPKRGKTWRIEGPFDSTYSLALVNRETARAMADFGWTVALHSTEGPGDFPPDPAFLKDNPDLAAMHQRAAKGSQKHSFAVSRLLYPPRVADMGAPITALHHYAWEESGFPHAWVDDFNASLTMMTTLSTHIEKIMVDNGVSVPLVTSGCGVDHWERIVPDPGYRVDARDFRFLHVSSCFPRKGVDALLAAYGQAFSIDDDVSLVIKTFDNPHNDLREKLAALQAQNPRYPHVVMIFGDISDAQLKSLYGQCHVMVGPSFAEGYGLPFAEAMLTGIPVITTNWGGQLDFCNAGNSWLVDYRFERSTSHLGVWSSAWARVEVAGLTQAMRDAHATSPARRAAMAARGREQLLARHQWTDVARRLSAAAATLPARPQRDPHIGWISTWHSKCGIATYSQHLIKQIPGPVTVYSPKNEATLLGVDRSIRIWKQSKFESNLWKIPLHSSISQVDVVVIQFNFAFFDHADLSELVRALKAMNKKVVIVLHSTVYPFNDHNPQNYHLEWLVATLSQCDRILVHAIKDLNRLKDIGLVENVALFPHGVLRRPEPPQVRSPSRRPTIATYGFALPHKGLPEMLEAVRLLHDRGRHVRLKMVNAEYPAEVSTTLIEQLKTKVGQLQLAQHVEMHNRFLPDDESMAMLTDADLVVFPYQNTDESASGAVRYGMAVERPVAVTPLPIFGDLDGATFRLPGTSAADLADGIAATLDALAANTPDVVAIAERAASWRDQHDYNVVGRRLFNICKALANR